MVTATVVHRQREVFALLSEFFERVAGEDVASFSKRGDFSSTIRSNADSIAQRGWDAFRWFEPAYRDFYAKTSTAAFGDARSLGGMKLVLGGSGRFKESQFESVRKMLLYADTVLVPDPVLPWFEQDRTEEKFRHVHVLETVFWLLHLKPLVDADLPYPAVVVFPSWERSLELRDEVTRQSQQRLIAETIGHHIGRPNESFDSQIEYALGHEADFLEAVDRSKLFLAPGAESPEPLKAGIERYKDEVRQWRSPDHVKQLQALPLGHLVLNGLWERIGPQYHMLENAEELHAHPMMCLEAHWYYFELITTAMESRLQSAGLLSDRSVGTLRAINQPELKWLGNVPISSLVQLRTENANEQFRRSLDQYTKDLHGAALGDVDRITAEVAHGLAALLAQHQNELKNIEKQYRLDHLKTLTIGVTTAAAMFVPALAPLVGSLAAPVGLAGKYVYDKANERQDRSVQSNSLVGILSRARRAG